MHTHTHPKKAKDVFLHAQRDEHRMIQCVFVAKQMPERIHGSYRMRQKINMTAWFSLNNNQHLFN